MHNRDPYILLSVQETINKILEYTQTYSTAESYTITAGTSMLQ
jgi:hypothetical protein